jgi:hypothetical protein
LVCPLSSRQGKYHVSFLAPVFLFYRIRESEKNQLIE